MVDQNESISGILDTLEERAKELNCLYTIEGLLTDSERTLDELLSGVVQAIPPGWQYSDCCRARVELNQAICASPGFEKTPWTLTAGIVMQGETVGKIEVCYIKEMPQADEGPFLKEERKLINTIAERLGHFVLHQDLVRALAEWQITKEKVSRKRQTCEWGRRARFAAPYRPESAHAHFA